MMPDIPWNLQGIDPEAKANAELSAQRAGVSVSQWMNSILHQSTYNPNHYPHAPFGAPTGPVANAWAASQPHQNAPYQNGVAHQPVHNNVFQNYPGQTHSGQNNAGQNALGIEPSLVQINSQISSLAAQLDTLTRAGAETAISAPRPTAAATVQLHHQNIGAASTDNSEIRVIEQTLKHIVDLIEATDVRTNQSLEEMQARIETAKITPETLLPITEAAPIPTAECAQPGNASTGQKTRFEARRDRRRNLRATGAPADLEKHDATGPQTQVEHSKPRTSGTDGGQHDFISLARSLETALEKTNAAAPAISPSDIEALKTEVRALAVQVANSAISTPDDQAMLQALRDKLELISVEVNNASKNLGGIATIDQKISSLFDELAQTRQSLLDNQVTASEAAQIALHEAANNPSDNGRREQELQSLHSQLDQISSQLSSQLNDKSNVSGTLADIENKIGLLFERIQNVQHHGAENNVLGESDSTQLTGIENKIAMLAEQIQNAQQNSAPVEIHSADDSGQLADIENKLGMLFDHLQKMQQNGASGGQYGPDETAHLIEIEHKVGLLFDHLQDSHETTLEASRQIAGEAAQLAVREATQEAVRTAAEHVAKYLPERISGNEIEIVRNLETGLKEVRASAEQSDHHTQKTLNAVQDSLHAILDRLTYMETAEPAQEYSGTAPIPHSMSSDEPDELSSISGRVPRVELTPTEYDKDASADMRRQPDIDLPLETEDYSLPRPSNSKETMNAMMQNDGGDDNESQAISESVRPLEPGSRQPAPILGIDAADPADQTNQQITSDQPHTEPEMETAAGTSLRDASTNEELLAAARRAARNAASATATGKPGKKSLRERLRRPKKALKAAPAKAPLEAKQPPPAEDKSSSEKIFGMPRKPVLLTSIAILMFVGSMKIYGMMANQTDGEGISLPAFMSSPPAIERSDATSDPGAGSPTNEAPLGAAPEEPANITLSAPPRDQEIDPGTPLQNGDISSFGANQNQEITGSLPADGQNLADAANSIQSAALAPVGASEGMSQTPMQPMLEMPPAIAGNQQLRRAAASGNAAAQFEIASILAEGRGIAPDPKRAAIWYQHAAAQGLAPAQYRLGSMYEKGQGVTQDRNSARIWYQRAAELGNRKAMHNLAVLYADGINGEPDMANAARWFRKAAEFGLNDSQFNLGILHARGLGVPRNLVEAYKWLSIAAANGDADAAQRRDMIAKELDQQTLTATRLAVQTWRAEPLVAEANTIRLPLAEWGSAAGAPQTPELPGRDIVRNTQKLLTQLGFDPGPADGVWGPRTRAAIGQFEGREDLPQTGRLTPQIFQKLQLASGRGAGA